MDNLAHSDNRSLIDEVESEIFKTNLDLSKDFTEVGLDLIIENELLSQIPIVKTATAFYNVGKEFNKRNHIRNLLTFLSEFHKGNVSNQKLSGFKRRFDQNPKFRIQVLELILLHNERFNRTIKSKIMGNLFRSYINGNITFEKLSHLLEILDSITVRGLKILEAMGEGGRWYYDFVMKIDPWLEEINFYSYEFTLLSSCSIAFQEGKIFRITDDGITLYKYGIVN
ncbi:hypothetical protein GO009_05975 [Muricauda sp. TY007]|uniref:hypothetical protein n=1 Tax=Allomuricauda sp. TY007 TaxID=2683200 RepID=UPI0013C15BEB|nr:hypothetical protein [Muricauda sp. TY007]NDV15569.1 hypothetical protein [Muricauda sp. TY007]